MKKINPIEQSGYIENEFRDYVKSTFQIQDEVYQKEFNEELKKAKLCKGPFISSELPFVKGHSIRELVQEGKVSTEFLKLSEIDFDQKLYYHQEKSMELINNRTQCSYYNRNRVWKNRELFISNFKSYFKRNRR